MGKIGKTDGAAPVPERDGAAEGRALVANWQTLPRVFIRSENEAVRSTLLKYMEQILFGLHDFLRQHVGITEAQSLKKRSERFQDSLIHDHPRRKLAEVIQGIIEDPAPFAVNVTSPYFVGHMTSAIPFFMGTGRRPRRTLFFEKQIERQTH
jgi:glutamate decarboxylase